MAYSLFRANFRIGRELLVSAAAAGLLRAPALHAEVTAAGGEVNASIAIKVDQVGYPLKGPKVAMVSAPAETFEVHRSSDEAVVFRGKLTAAAADALSGDTVAAADF
jgi:hypothetical protein